MTQRIRLSAQDAVFLLAETRNTPIHVAGLQVFKVPDGASPHYVSELFADLRSHPVSAAPFNYRLSHGVMGKLMPSWEILDDIDLDYHLRHSALPYPGGERELGVLVSRLHSIPMDLSRPLWEFHLIEGLENNRFAIYCKLHHALVDGVNSIRLINLVSDPAKSFGEPIWAEKSGDRDKNRAGRSGLIEALPSLVRQEAMALPSMAQGLITSAMAAAGVARDDDLASINEAPRTILNVKIGGQRRVATHVASVDRIKAIGRGAGGTLNDVVLAACGGALRRYLDDLGELPDETLIASVPVALHRDAGDASGNAVASLAVRLGTDTANVRTRFDQVKRSSAAGKAHLGKMSNTAAMNFTLLMATPVLLTTLPLVGALVPPPFNLIISNVPGPRDKLYLHGAEMEAYYPVSQVGHGQALNITVLSYAGQLAFGFVSCRDSVPHMQRLAVYMGEAIEELESTFLGKAATGKSKSARVAKQRKKPAGKARKKSAKRKAAPRNKRSGERTAGKPAAKKAKRGSR
jgi:diacylglycerol O-acyltransferase / wax synthase